MTTIYSSTPSSRITFAQLDSNFYNLSENKLEQTSNTGAAKIPVGNNIIEGTPSVGSFRFNSDTMNFECKYNSVWSTVGARGNVGNLANVFRGSLGATGIANVSEGYTGSRGYTGSVGATGDRGFRGPRGFTGSTGFKGTNGLNGLNNDTAGPVGYVGSRGYTGSATNTIIQGATVNPEGFTVGTTTLKPGYGNSTTGSSFSSTGNIYLSTYSTTTYQSTAALNINVYGPVNEIVDLVKFKYNNTEICRFALRNNVSGLDGRPPGLEFGMLTSETAFLYLNSGSDYRLKENLVISNNEVTNLNKINLYNFNFKRTPNYTDFGFIAHEIQEYIPEMVTYEKDQIDDTGVPMYQILSKYAMIPFLLSCLTELNEEVKEIEQLLGQQNG